MLAYKLLRLSFDIWRLVGILLVVALCVTAPQLVVLVVVGALVYGVKQRWRPGGWAHGTARWADYLDMLHCFGPQGMYVGTVAPPLKAERFRLLRQAPKWAGEQVLRLFFSKGNLFVRLSRGVHTLIVAPAGAGKSAGVVIPFLRECRDSVVVMDPKGELYKATAAERKKLGQKIVVIDPFRVSGAPVSDCFNPLDCIDKNHDAALDKIRALAKAIAIREPTERDPHWVESAELWLTAIIAFVLTAKEVPGNHRHLQSVVAILSDPERLPSVIELMKKDDESFGGMLPRLAGQLGYYVEKERSSVLTTTSRLVKFLSSPAVLANTVRTTFDPAKLRDGMTVYLCLPPQYQKSHAGLMRLWVEGMLQIVIASGAVEDKLVHMVLDEAASLGRMESIENAVTQLRGYGLRMTFIYQSLGQLKACFTEGQDVTMRANFDNQVFFGLNDHATAEEVSKMLGQQTIVTTSASGGTSKSKNRDHMGQESHSQSSNDNWSAQEAGRALLDPAEVLQLDARNAIVFSKGMPPLMTYLQRHYEGPKEMVPNRFMMLMRAGVLAATSATMAAGAVMVGWLVFVGR